MSHSHHFGLFETFEASESGEVKKEEGSVSDIKATILIQRTTVGKNCENETRNHCDMLLTKVWVLRVNKHVCVLCPSCLPPEQQLCKPPERNLLLPYL